MNRLVIFVTALVALLKVCSGQGGITRELVGVLARQDDKLDQVIEKADAVLEKLDALEEALDKVSEGGEDEGPPMPDFCWSDNSYCSQPNYFSDRDMTVSECRDKCIREARCKSFDHHDGECHIMPEVCKDDKLRTGLSSGKYYYVKPMQHPEFLTKLQESIISGGAAAAAADPCKVFGNEFQSYVAQE